MKILFASDIHGSPESLMAFVKHIDSMNPGQIVLLGDLLYHGPRNPLRPDYAPPEVSTILNQYKERIVAVRGNCDSEVDQMLLEFPMMSDYSILLVDGRKFFLTHGHHWNPGNVPPLGTADVLANGHTHVPMLQKDSSGLAFFNPGSISLPKQGNPPSFGLYENGVLSVRRLEDAEAMFSLEL